LSSVLGVIGRAPHSLNSPPSPAGHWLLPCCGAGRCAGIQALRAGNLGSLIDMDDDLARDAAIDGLWQALMLAGVRERMPLHGELWSYEAPTYYGCWLRRSRVKDQLIAAFVPRFELLLANC
jgi:hypothetical protein